jgi:cystathionine beta-lyase/cystathionine gamma-synthase
MPGTAEIRARLGISDTLVRLSVGVETSTTCRRSGPGAGG